MKMVKKELFLDLSYFDALRIGNPLYDSLPRATFHGTTIHAWTFWAREIFRELLSPILHQALQLATLGHTRELEVINEQISKSLPDSIRETSLYSGRWLLLALRAPCGERTLKKLTRRLELHPEYGCHFAVAYAARCAAFHFSPFLCEASYLYQEAWTAFSSKTDLGKYLDIALREGGHPASSSIAGSYDSLPEFRKRRLSMA